MHEGIAGAARNYDIHQKRAGDEGLLVESFAEFQPGAQERQRQRMAESFAREPNPTPVGGYAHGVLGAVTGNFPMCEFTPDA